MYHYFSAGRERSDEAVIENMFDQEDHCERLSNATLFQRGHGLVTSMLAIVTNKVMAAYYFKKDVMAISTFKKLNEAFTTLPSTR